MDHKMRRKLQKAQAEVRRAKDLVEMLNMEVADRAKGASFIPYRDEAIISLDEAEEHLVDMRDECGIELFY